LFEDDKLDTMGHTTTPTHSADEKQTVGSDHPSNATSVAVNDKEKSELLGRDDPVTKKILMSESKGTVTYAKGAEAFFVMLALLLSITLCSLDQVSITSRLDHRTHAPFDLTLCGPILTISS
jgi:hypothetical protein